jgi:hypothetical protein
MSCRLSISVFFFPESANISVRMRKYGENAVVEATQEQPGFTHCRWQTNLLCPEV